MAVWNLCEKVNGCSTMLLSILQGTFKNSNIFKEVVTEMYCRRGFSLKIYVV